MKNRIIISVTSDISTDQRVLKVAKSCYSKGYDVLLIGRKVKSSKPLYLPFQFIRMRLLFNHSVLFYIEFNIRLFILLLFKRSTVFLSNDTDTLVANFLASKICRKKLVFDAHELFPEVPELVNRPKVKYFWQKLEDIIFPQLANTYTVCDSIAKYYNQKYNIDMQVVRNVPYFRSNKSSIKKIDYPNKKIILYQGALNVGRGLEWVIAAMPLIENAILVIIGDGDIRQNLQNQTIRLQIENKVSFLGKIEAEKLHEYTTSADIGLCLLEKMGLSYYYALPNRIFDYLQADVPVLASRFPEISKIVETYKTGTLIDHYDPQYLADTINNMLSFPFKTDHFGSAAKELCWENEEIVLMEIINKAI
jgi:glycosyltransferase involved in cell wall biosynthesis